MGRVVLVVLVIVTVIVLWKAFGPKTWNNAPGGSQKSQFPPLGIQKIRGGKGSGGAGAKGPDDDPDFLWNIKKERFKAQREAEKREQEAVDRARRGEHWDADSSGKTAENPSAKDAAQDADKPEQSPEKNVEKNSDKKPGNNGSQEKKDGEAGA